MAEKRYEFTVTGEGPFPADMLRYDACWPRTQDDVQASFPGGPRHGVKLPRAVTLRGVKPPTVGRWESFGWKVSRQREERI